MESDDIFGDVIFRYTREEAIRDGVLVDISSSKATIEAGIKVPVAVTTAVFNILKPGNDLIAQGQDFEGRLWDLWMIFLISVRRQNLGTDEVHFAPLFLLPENEKPVPVKMWAKCGPGDNAEPVITIMMEGED